jgi:PPK2 family polyphosphate:nucleotide phosphotransferase
MKLKSPYLVKPHTRVRLSQWDSSAEGHFKGSEDDAAGELAKHLQGLADAQELFYASQKKALLIVLQGMDTAGKDGTIRHIFTGVNPQGCDVAAFKVPTILEARHDFLWRCHLQVPARGMIGIFNRSHYEDVLSPVVHQVITHKQARQHIDDINEFESMLADNDVVILKFFLHISKQEQKSRLQARIDAKDKHWKLSESDFAERKFWDKYAAAYEEIFSKTSTKHAPWFIIPSDHKWFRNLAVSRIVLDAMQGMKLKYPAPSFDPSKVKL